MAMHQHTNSNMDEIINNLAKALIAGQEKRALEEKDRFVKLAVGEQPTPAWNQVRDTFNQYVGNPVNDFVTNQFVNNLGDRLGQGWAKHLGYGAVGAGLGAGLGGLTQLFADKRRRRPLSSILTGAMLGGTLGAGGSVLHEQFNKPTGPPGPRATDAAQNVGNASGANSQVVNDLLARYRLDPGQIQAMLRSIERGRGGNLNNADSFYDTFINERATDPSGLSNTFTLPPNSQHADALASLRVPGSTNNEYRFTSTNNMNPQALSAIRNILREGASSARDNNLGGGINSALREMGDRIDPASNTNQIAARGRSNQSWYSHLNPWNQQGISNSVARGTGVGSYVPGVQPETGGLLNNISRATAPTNNLDLSDEFLDSPRRFSQAREHGLNPRALISLDVEGPAQHEDFLTGLLGRPRPDGTTWNTENITQLRQALPSILQQVRSETAPLASDQGSVRDRVHNLSSAAAEMPYSSTGISALDTLGTAAGLDASMSFLNGIRNRITGYNPNHLARALSTGTTETIQGLVPGLSGQQINYLQRVNTTHGVAGLRALSSDVTRYATQVGIDPAVLTDPAHVGRGNTPLHSSQLNVVANRAGRPGLLGRLFSPFGGMQQHGPGLLGRASNIVRSRPVAYSALGALPELFFYAGHNSPSRYNNMVQQRLQRTQPQPGN